MRLHSLVVYIVIVGLSACQASHQATGPERVDCDPILQRINSNTGDASVGQRTYDFHSSTDTAADRVTASKGCILARWVGQFDSARGRPPVNLEELPRLDSAHVVPMPSAEWMRDGWGQVFVYARDSGAVVLHSMGPDGRDSTGDEKLFVRRR